MVSKKNIHNYVKKSLQHSFLFQLHLWRIFCHIFQSKYNARDWMQRQIRVSSKIQTHVLTLSKLFQCSLSMNGIIIHCNLNNSRYLHSHSHPIIEQDLTILLPKSISNLSTSFYFYYYEPLSLDNNLPSLQAFVLSVLSTYLLWLW